MILYQRRNDGTMFRLSCWRTRLRRKVYTLLDSFDRCTSQVCKENRTVALYPSGSTLRYNCHMYLDQQSPASNQLDNFGTVLCR